MFEKKLDTDPYLDLLSNSNPVLHEEILREFLKHPETRVALTRHEKTPLEILRAISKEKETFSQNILSHPNCPPELIEERLKSGKEDDLIAIAKNCAIEESIIREIAKSSYAPVLTWVCRRPDCPSDILEDLFSTCEQQWDSAKTRMQQETQVDNSTVLFDDEFLFDEIDDFGMYYEVDEYLLEAIAANPNTPKSVFKKMMGMDVQKKSLFEGSLGSTLLGNPSVDPADKAYLTLQGIAKVEDNSNNITSMIGHYGLPTSQAFEYSMFPLKFLEALNEIGHPSALLRPELKLIDRNYDFNDLVDYWVKHETIYRTLWPELSERNDVFFWYQRSSYDGDQFFFSIPGVEFEHEFSRGSYTYNSMSYPFFNRPWVETIETMDVEMSHENFSYRDFDDFYYYSDDGDQYDLILAAILSKNSWEREVSVPQYSLTKKGEEFICEWAESFFEDDRDMKVKIHLEKALPYSWKAMQIEKKNQIVQIIVDGFNQKVDKKFQYAEHFLVCIALHPSTPESIRETLKVVDSIVVTQALSVS